MKFDDLLKARNVMKKKKPAFLRQNNWKKKRITHCNNWRRPTGIDSKMRLGLNGKSNVVSPGFGSPRAVKGLRRDGLREVAVANVDDLKRVVAGCIGVVCSGVGARKKIQIIQLALKHKIALANYDESFVKEFESEMKTRKDSKAKSKEQKSKKKAVEKTPVKGAVQDDKAAIDNSAEDIKKEREKALIKKGAL